MGAYSGADQVVGASLKLLTMKSICCSYDTYDVELSSTVSLSISMAMKTFLHMSAVPSLHL